MPYGETGNLEQNTLLISFFKPWQRITASLAKIDSLPLQATLMNLQKFQHDQSEKIGVLLANLGTPDAPDTASVRRYLKEFLWDPRVVEIPRLAWWFVLNIIILNTRPARSAKAYQKVWTDKGSPLLVISRDQEKALRNKLKDKYGNTVCLELGMRYGSPSIETALKALRDQGARRIIVLPLYPQYSATTTASIFDEVSDQVRKWRWLPELRFINQYHDNTAYITALADSIKRYRAEHGTADKLVMSFHGIPEEYFHKGDPYYCQCQKTGRLLADKLDLKDTEWVLSFQSRLGPKQWLQPYTEHTVKQLGADGIKSVQVVCPGFSADCLETLEEVAMENRDFFLEAGGEQYEYIACLNDEPSHIDMLSNLIEQHTSGWSISKENPEHILQRAQKMGAKQ